MAVRWMDLGLHHLTLMPAVSLLRLSGVVLCCVECPRVLWYGVTMAPTAALMQGRPSRVHVWYLVPSVSPAAILLFCVFCTVHRNGQVHNRPCITATSPPYMTASSPPYMTASSPPYMTAPSPPSGVPSPTMALGMNQAIHPGVRPAPLLGLLDFKPPLSPAHTVQRCNLLSLQLSHSHPPKPLPQWPTSTADNFLPKP